MTDGDVYCDGFKYWGHENTEKYSIQTSQGGEIRGDFLEEVTLVLRLEGINQTQEKAESVLGRRTNLQKGTKVRSNVSRKTKLVLYCLGVVLRGEVGGISSRKLLRMGVGTESQFCRHRELLADFRQGCDTLRVWVLERFPGDEQVGELGEVKHPGEKGMWPEAILHGGKGTKSSWGEA